MGKGRSWPTKVQTSDRIIGLTPLRFSSFVTCFILFSPSRAAVFFTFFYVCVYFFFKSPQQLKCFNHRTMWGSLVRRKTFLYFSSLPPLPHRLPPSLFPPHFVSRVLKSQCKYILRGIYNSGNGGGSGSPVSAAGWRRLRLGRTFAFAETQRGKCKKGAVWELAAAV